MRRTSPFDALTFWTTPVSAQWSGLVARLHDLTQAVLDSKKSDRLGARSSSPARNAGKSG
jgi:hypothetical protein